MTVFGRGKGGNGRNAIDWTLHSANHHSFHSSATSACILFAKIHHVRVYMQQAEQYHTSRESHFCFVPAIPHRNSNFQSILSTSISKLTQRDKFQYTSIPSFDQNHFHFTQHLPPHATSPPLLSIASLPLFLPPGQPTLSPLQLIHLLELLLRGTRDPSLTFPHRQWSPGVSQELMHSQRISRRRVHDPLIA